MRLSEIFDREYQWADADSFKSRYHNHYIPISCEKELFALPNWLEICYIWDRHSLDIHDSDYTSIQTWFEEFVARRDVAKVMTLIEWSKNWKTPSREEFVNFTSWNTPTFVKFLCEQHWVSFDCPEPKEQDIQEVIYKLWITHSEYALYKLVRRLRTMVWLNDLEITKDLLLTYFPSNDSLWSHEQLFLSTFGESIYDIYKSSLKVLIDPTIEWWFTNYIRRITGNMREISILNAIQNYVDDWYSVFIVYGHGHFLLHKPIIRKWISILQELH